MAAWDLSEVASGQVVKSAHVRQASNDWQGDVDANGHDLTAVGTLSGETVDVEQVTTYDLTVYDDTPTTGVTSVTIKAGAGQATSNLVLFTSISDTVLSGIGAGGQFFSVLSGAQKCVIYQGTILHSSDAGISWKDQTDINTAGSYDTNIGRASAGVLKITDGSGNLRDLTLRRLQRSVNAVSYSATPTFDAALGDPVITLTGNVSSSTLTNPIAGQTITFKIIQDGTGGRSFVWPTNVLGGMTIDSGALANEIYTQQFHCFDGTNFEAISLGATR